MRWLHIISYLPTILVLNEEIIVGKRPKKKKRKAHESSYSIINDTIYVLSHGATLKLKSEQPNNIN